MITRVTEAGVNLKLAVLAVEARRTLALVVLEAELGAGAAVTARVREAHITLGLDGWVSFLCK